MHQESAQDLFTIKMSIDAETDIVHLDVSGTVFKTQLSTLKTIPNSRLAHLQHSNKRRNQSPDVFYFDRDADSFKHILNAYRDGTLHISRDVCPQQFRRELEFWNIPIQLLAPCCWKTFYSTQDDVHVINALMKRLKTHLPNNNKIHTELHGQGIKQAEGNGGSAAKKNAKEQTRPNKLWLFLEEPTSSRAAKVTYLFN